jgi:hypothetical protein
MYSPFIFEESHERYQAYVHAAEQWRLAASVQPHEEPGSLIIHPLTTLHHMFEALVRSGQPATPAPELW